MSDTDRAVPRVRWSAASWDIFEPIRVRRSAALRWIVCFGFWLFLIACGFVGGWGAALAHR